MKMEYAAEKIVTGKLNRTINPAKANFNKCIIIIILNC
jgi:hypothetical protein